ncbi:MAG: hypothetical protein P1U57_12855 [Oleibacter sp.]|nr:hypothetical protein [Thalassolituus sp.]
MKRLLLSTFVLTSVAANAADEDTNYSFTEALKNGDASFDMTIGYFNRGFDDPVVDNAEALTGGGIVKYETGSFNNFKVGVAYYGSHSLFGIVDRDKGRGTAFLQTDGDDIAFIGEGYIDFDNGSHQVKVGRQRLSTPLIEDHNIRLLPSSYEAVIYRNKTIENTMIEFGYINSYSGFTSRESGFEAPEASWGEDGLAYIYATTLVGIVSLRGQFVDTLDDSGSRKNYRYADAGVPIKIGQKTYVKAQYGGTAYQEIDTSHMLGLKTGTTVSNVDLALSYNSIRDGNFQAVEAGPMYTDWQQGYGPYQPSDAYGAQVTFYPTTKSSIKLGYVDVNGKQGSRVDEFVEQNVDARYKFTDASSFRVRYSIKDQEFEDASGRFDRTDLRIYYYQTFKF